MDCPGKEHRVGECSNNSSASASKNITVLSAKELFQWRKRDNLTVPQRGGTKEYEPDGSWLQDKQLEAFYEEQLNALREPRVEKSGSLVKGTWNAELRLVNIEKTAKFWMKMGFTEQHRNWLHPEEALFLMEVNSLDVMQQGVSMSLQEAYHALLQPTCDVSEEEYQVYSHLRRLGFIVIRHAGKLDLTPYERKIGLDKHSRKKNKKRSKKSETAEGLSQPKRKQTDHSEERQQKEELVPKSTVDNSSLCSSSERSRLHGDHSTGHSLDSKAKENISLPLTTVDRTKTAIYSGSNGSMEQKLDTENRTKREADTSRSGVESLSLDTSSDEPPKKKSRVGSPERNMARGENRATAAVEYDCDTLDLWSQATRQSLLQQGHRSPSLSTWDFSEIGLPDIGGRDTVSLAIPRSDLLPANVCVDEEYDDVCMFDVEEYRLQQQQCLTQDQGDGYDHLKQMEFSYASWCKENSRPVTAKNWRQWKAELHSQQQGHASVLQSPVNHLWKGDVTPLVQPKDAVSTAFMLEKLAVVQTFKGPLPVTQSKDPVKIAFDVYLPNTSFRKSSPGLPNHRVCVARGQRPPDVFEMHAATAHLDDGVPLHWAVVNCGDVSFFVFDDLDIPVHPSSLG